MVSGAYFLRPLTLILLVTGWLCACTLTPLYSQAIKQKLAQVHVLPIAEREGQVIKIALNEQLNPENLDLQAAYRLQLSTDLVVQQIFPNARAVRRARGTLRVTGTLVDLSGREIWAGSVQRSGLFAQSDLPSLSTAVQEDLWVDLASWVAQDVRAVLAHALADE